MNSAVTTIDAETATGMLFNTITELVAEMQPQGRPQRSNIHLESRLERDLGLDSLGKTELLLRLERLFHISLPEHALHAATVGELLDQLLASDAPAQAPVARVRLRQEETRSIVFPEHAQTLNEVLGWYAEQQPKRIAIHLYEDSETPQPISYSEWWRNARFIAAGLRQRGLSPGDSVALMLPTGANYFYSFIGILLAGGVPVPIYPPTRPNQIEEHLLRHGRILANARTTMLITVTQAKTIARLLRTQVPTLADIVTAEELAQATGTRLIPDYQARAQDLAFLQYTSGSTGDPKGVQLSHANLLANVRAMGKRVKAGAGDVFVSWLPLYHDMGLIGACFGSLYHGMALAVMSPLRFLRRPASWLWAIHHHSGTLSAAPNFAYELCLRNIQDSDIDGLDLSSLRWAFNGAEPVNANTLRRFAERFEPYGLDPHALAPVYGLAECSVGLAIPEPGRGLQTDRIKRLAFMQQGIAVRSDSPDSLEIVACGHALAGHQIRIVDESGRELPERREGRLQFKGPSATAGYLRNNQANADLFEGDWLQSGDRAYIAEGDVYISGRSKDMIIRAGRNIYPYELEQCVGEINGVRKGCVAVFASRAIPVPGENAGERLIVVAETRETDTAKLAELRERIQEHSADLLELVPDDIVLAPPHAVLKTSSGKIRRNAIRELYENGTLGHTTRATWWQLIRVAGNGIYPELRRLGRRLSETLFNIYAWGVYALHAVLLALLLLLIPKPNWRWRFVGFCSRSALRLSGIGLQTDSDPETDVLLADKNPCILIVNHASYVDSLVLPGALATLSDTCFRFVAKRELTAVPGLTALLQRMGTLFVERFDLQRSQEDAARVGDAVKNGESLIFFPEGTFTRMPGLLPFRMGAFVAATQASVPVIPVVMHGTRSMLRADSWFFRRSALRITIDKPIAPTGTDWQAAVLLRNEAREAMLRLSAEPDLSAEDAPF